MLQTSTEEYHQRWAGGGNKRIRGFFKKAKWNFSEKLWVCLLKSPAFKMWSRFAVFLLYYQCYFLLLSFVSQFLRADFEHSLHLYSSECKSCKHRLFQMLLFDFLHFSRFFRVPPPCWGCFWIRFKGGSCRSGNVQLFKLHEPCLKALSIRCLYLISRKKVFITQDRI